MLLLPVVLAAAVADPIAAWVRANQGAIVAEFKELLAIPNVSADRENIQRNADHIAAMLRRRGLEVRLLDGAGGPPAVYGRLHVPGARRTIGVYAHYDGQPVDPSEWTSPPFVPTLRDGPLDAAEARIYARGASDDKAPIVGWAAALDALAATGRAPSVNVVFLFEGEEEAGSRHLEAVMRQNQALLKADLWLLCDGPVHQSRKAQLFFGARGIVGAELLVFGPLRQLHSGHYGNWAPNPALLLAELVAGLEDANGRILIGGFYDDVRPPTQAERAALDQMPAVDSELREALGLAASRPAGGTLAESVLLPAVNVRGLEAGGVGKHATNAIPTEAHASLDFRLVPDQTPERVREQFEAHLSAHGFKVVAEPPDAATRRRFMRLVQVTWGEGYPPARTPLDSPPARALAAAVAEARGDVLRAPTLGGSVPMYLFPKLLGTPVIGLPIANHDNNQHAANENLRLQNLWDAIGTYAAVLETLGARLDAEGLSDARSSSALRLSAACRAG